MSGPRPRRIARLLFIFYVLEAGAFLVMAPWSRFWLRRVVARSPEIFRAALMSPYFRSFLVAVGLLHIFVAIREIEAWRREGAAPPPVPEPAESAADLR